MRSEIGSEFWDVELSTSSLFVDEDELIYCLSGRTALHLIISDILNSKCIKKACLPAYCCHSMIQPFLDSNIEVDFYKVEYRDGEFISLIDDASEYDMVLVLQYFGYKSNQLDSLIEKLKMDDTLIIEDATHSWFSERKYSKISDYVFSSLRKWTGLPCGAIAIKRNGEFSNKSTLIENHEYVRIRQEAELLKKKYIEHLIEDKGEFLSLFNYAETYLESNYKYFGVQNEIVEMINNLDSKRIRESRRRNAKIIVRGIEGIEELWSVNEDSIDGPLFVPVIANDGSRDELRRYLIMNDVYCPVHWPLSELHTLVDDFIYSNCISIVCDQRYDESDMHRIVKLIRGFYGKDS